MVHEEIFDIYEIFSCIMKDGASVLLLMNDIVAFSTIAIIHYQNSIVLVDNFRIQDLQWHLFLPG